MRKSTLTPTEGLSNEQGCAWRVSMLRALSAAYRFSLTRQAQARREEHGSVTAIDDNRMALEES